MFEDPLRTALIKSLPLSGAVLVVHSTSLRNYCMRIIAEHFGEFALKRILVKSIHNGSEADYALTGRSVPIFFDHAFRENVSPVLNSYTSRLADASNISLKV